MVTFRQRKLKPKLEYMHIAAFKKLELEIGDYIWIMNERGEGYWGNYAGEYNPSNQTFKFKNHSNGQTETIEIQNLQKLQKG
jgi:hypothetical protein